MDRAKSARGWQRAFADYPAGNLDSEGALASLASPDTTAMYFFSSASNATGIVNGPPVDRGGRFRLTFTGSATVDFSNAGTGVTMINANTYEFDCDWNGNKWFIFTPTAFPVKVTLVKTDHITAHAAGEIYEPRALNYYPTGGCVRLMGPMQVNNSTVSTWAGYGAMTDQRWRRVPFPAMVDFCTRKDMDGWFNVPHLADDAFVTSMATYLRDNFPTGRKIRIELSNEIWNFGFTQAAHFFTQAETDWGVSGGTAWLSAAGKRFVQVMQIFNTVFVGQTHRLIGVIAGQAANTTNTIAMLDAPQWLASDPGTYIAPHTLAKEVSIAPYINWTSPGATSRGNDIKTQLDISSAAAVAYIKGMIPASVVQSKAWINNHVTVAVDRDLRLTMYEFNNHYDLFACSASTLYSAGEPVAGALDAFIEATYAQEMADAQDEVRAYFKAQNGSLMAFFQDLGAASKFGTWGANTHFDHDGPIWADLLSWHAANTRWWAQ